jgi:integrase/recombinase XerD
VTQLRKMMLEELQRRNYAQTTVEVYTAALRQFAEYFHRPPKLASEGTRKMTSDALKS